MSTVTAKEARRSFSDLLARAAYGKERVTVTRNGKPSPPYRFLTRTTFPRTSR